MTAYYTKTKSPLEPLSPDEFASFSFEDYKSIEDQRKEKQQFMPPIVTTGRLAAVKVENLPASPQQDTVEQKDFNTVQQTSTPQDAVCRVSFVGPDQQWYSVKIGHTTGPMQAMPAQSGQQMPMMQMQPSQQMPMMQMPMMQGQMMQGQMQPGQQMPMMQMMQGQMPMMQMQPSQQMPMMQAQMPMMQASTMQAQAATMQTQQVAQSQQMLHKAWRDDDPLPITQMFGNANMRTAEWMPDAAKPEEDESSKNFILQIVQPGLTGLMDGSVSTLAPIFSVAFATHNPFTAFIVGLASALGAGISMAFSEALSDDGELSGRGRPFLRGGVTGLMTFLSGLGHALPFLIPNLGLALTMAYIVVAVELIAIAAIRHKFFGTGWLLSMIQVVGGGALVFAVALLLGNV